MLIQSDAPVLRRTLEYDCNHEGNYTNVHISLAVKGKTKGLFGGNKRPKQASDSSSPALFQLSTIWEGRPPESALVSAYSITLNELTA